MRSISPIDTPMPRGTTVPNVMLPAGTTGVVIFATPDEEVNALNVCLTALRGLDANAAARVAHYLADRHSLVETAA